VTPNPAGEKNRKQLKLSVRTKACSREENPSVQNKSRDHEIESETALACCCSQKKKTAGKRENRWGH
jgi:hypothetical protein